MATLRELLTELEGIASAKKSKLTESAAHETVKYISRMKEAFGDMENGVEADEAPADEGEGAADEVVAAPEKATTVDEKIEALEKRIAALEAKLEVEGDEPVEEDKKFPWEV
jgi:hypothetical protein